MSQSHRLAAVFPELQTWSKWHRTRRCQCLRKSANVESVLLRCLSGSSLVFVGGALLTVVRNLLVVLDRLYTEKLSEPMPLQQRQSHRQLFEQCATHHCAGCGSSPSGPSGCRKESPVVKRKQFGGRSAGGARAKFLAGLGNPMRAVGNADSSLLLWWGSRTLKGSWHWPGGGSCPSHRRFAPFLLYIMDARDAKLSISALCKSTHQKPSK